MRFIIQIIKLKVEAYLINSNKFYKKHLNQQRRLLSVLLMTLTQAAPSKRSSLPREHVPAPTLPINLMPAALSPKPRHRRRSQFLPRSQLPKRRTALLIATLALKRSQPQRKPSLHQPRRRRRRR